MNKEIVIPLAYFITFTCYGTWLPGEKSMSVDRRYNTPGTPFLREDPIKAVFIRAQMSEQHYVLDHVRRDIVLKTILEVCEHRKWTLLAAHVRTNHVHMVIQALINPEQILNSIKSYTSLNLNKSKIDINRRNRWTRHGSTRYLWTEQEVESTIRYVIYEQGTPMAWFENKNRICAKNPYDYH